MLVQNGTEGYQLRARDMATRDPTAAVQLKFRVPEAMRARLEEAAKIRGWTLNAEITHRLEQSFQLDEERRSLDGEREYIRRSNAELARMHDDAQKRVNQLTDYLLQITAPNVRVPTESDK